MERGRIREPRSEYGYVSILSLFIHPILISGDNKPWRLAASTYLASDIDPQKEKKEEFDWVILLLGTAWQSADLLDPMLLEKEEEGQRLEVLVPPIAAHRQQLAHKRAHLQHSAVGPI